MIRSFKITLLCILISTVGSANDTLLAGQLIKRIADLQFKESGVFPAGSFPSYRQYALNKQYVKADINPFYTGLIALTLKDLMPRLTPAQQRMASQIISSSIPSFEKFKNRKNARNTYNFWPTDTPRIFPNSGFLNLFDKRQALPDDLDDTVILLLAMNAPDSTAENIHLLMQEYANNGVRQINNTFKEYRSIKAYSTWFGKIIPVDFDISVLCNVLFFVQRYNLKWTSADSASLQLIEKIIIDRRHMTDAGYVSPHYAKTPYILYHVARLMSVKPIPELEKLREQLVKDALYEYEQSKSFMDQVVLSTALLRWGARPEKNKEYHVTNHFDLIEDQDFQFFTANIAAMMPDGFKRFISWIKIGLFSFSCPAYNEVLLLENLLLGKQD